MPPLRITRAGILGSLLVFAVAATCVRLGFWQLHRLAERRARNAVVAARMGAPASSLDEARNDTAGLPFRRVSAHGTFDDQQTIVWAGRSFQGDPGVYVLTPLLLPGGGAILVNRGWLPSPDAATVDLRPYGVAGPASVSGILVPFPPPGGRVDTAPNRIRYHLDAQAVARLLPYPVEPLMLQELPASPRKMPRPIPPPALDEGPHFSYAVQWFSFAVIGIVGWVALLLRDGRGGPEPPRPE